MSTVDRTSEQSWSHGAGRGASSPRPGLVVVFSSGRAACDVHAAGAAPLVIGRDPACAVPLDDTRASRHHAEVTLAGDQWTIRDLKSRNGTFVDADARRTTWPLELAGVVSIGDSVCLLVPDVTVLDTGRFEVKDGVVIGPRLRTVWQGIERAAATADTLHLLGETGTGKDLAARHYHDASARRRGPFVAVNCAAVPGALAERLLFGARRGAYSGADSDTEGYLSAADNGTLFLDEIGDLPLDVQAKLLRAVESREVLPLGAARARPISIAICSASYGDLRARIADGRFRDDLYYRLAHHEIALPPLRARAEEIPWLVQTALEREGRTPHVSLIEAVLRRSWPGNVRELVNAVVAVARSHAADDGLVRARHLPATAGTEVARAAGAPPASSAPAPTSDDEIVAALRREAGNVQRAARALGLHRTQLRRWLASRDLDPTSFAPGGKKTPRG